MSNTAFVLSSLVSLALCSQSSAAIGVREMISEMIELDENTEPISLSVTQEKIGKKLQYFVDVEIVNHELVPLCIPVNLFHSRNMVLLPDILSISDGQGKLFLPLKSHQLVSWPIDRYVIVPKGSKNFTTIAISELFDLSSANAEIEVHLTILAFDCGAVVKGYPITNMISKESGLFSKLAPKRNIRRNEIHVFRGSVRVQTHNQ